MRDIQADDNGEHLYRYVESHYPDIKSLFCGEKESLTMGIDLKREGVRIYPFWVLISYIRVLFIIRLNFLIFITLAGLGYIGGLFYPEKLLLENLIPFQVFFFYQAWLLPKIIYLDG